MAGVVVGYNFVLVLLFCGLEVLGQSTIIDNVPQPESIVVASDGGYLVSSVGSAAAGTAGGIFKYSSSGDQDTAFTHVTGKSTKGLVVTADGATLYAAHDNVVTKYSISSTALTLVVEYSMTFAKPNGLCLSADESTLFVTDPGWMLSPMGISKDTTTVGGMAMVTLSTGAVVDIFTNQTDTYSPNGCKVKDGVVYIINFQHGVSTYTISGGGLVATTAWSEDRKVWQTGSPEFCGDGIVVHNNIFFLSFWRMYMNGTAPAVDGEIYQCPPQGSSWTCTKLMSGFAAADIDVHGSNLLLPILAGNRVLSVGLSGGSDLLGRANGSKFAASPHVNMLLTGLAFLVATCS